MKMSLKNGLLLGLIIGIGSAILCAPKSGKELREDLKKKVEAVPYHFLNFLESVVDLALSVLDFAKESFKEQGYKISKAVEQGVNAAKEKSKELKSFATSAGHSINN